MSTNSGETRSSGRLATRSGGLQPLRASLSNTDRSSQDTAALLSKHSQSQDDMNVASSSRGGAGRARKRRLSSEDEGEASEDNDTRRAEAEQRNEAGPSRRRRRVPSGESNNEEAPVPAAGDLTSTQDDEVSAMDEEHEVSDDEEVQAGTTSRPSTHSTIAPPTRQRDKDGYSPGEIVRVKLTNFVTYDFVEFSPGPHLNMIVGPNGTGKSTIVCAIALGLGYKPSVLGRAKEVSSYVKEGCDVGTIEIELKGQLTSDGNPVIQRAIKREDNTSEWRLGGNKATAKDIAAVVDDLGIEIGNLCCFLPQDKVADFAKMGPSELLQETQKAAGQPGMNAWHERLIELGKEQREMAGKISARDDEVRNLEERVEFLSRDVQRAEERRRIEIKLGALDVLVSEAEYGAMKIRWEDAKERKKEQVTKLAQLKSKLAPIRDRLVALEQGALTLTAELKTLRQNAKKEDEVCNKSFKMLQNFEDEVEKLSDQLDSVKKSEQSRKSAISQLRKDIAALEEAVRTEPPKPDTRQLDTRMRAIREQERTLSNEEAEGKTEEEDISSEIRVLDRDTNKARQRLVEIDNVKNGRLQMLQRADVDTYNAVIWLRQNTNLFREKVFEPVMLEISVRDQEMASAVEGCINFAAQKTFVCQTEEDYDLFGRTVADKMRLRVNFVHRQHARALHDFPVPATERELQRFGFDGYVLNLVEGPVPVLQYLCTDFHLESVPYARNENSVNAMEVETSGRFQRYITGRNLHTLSRSQYGSRAMQTMTRTLRNARTFVQSVDQTLRRSLDDEIQSISERKRLLETRAKEITAQAATRRQRYDDFRTQRNALEQQKGDMLKKRGMWEKDGHRLAAKKTALKEQEDQPSAAQKSRKFVTRIMGLNVKAQKTALEVGEILRKQIDLRQKGDLLELQVLERAAKVDALSNLKEQEEGQFQEAEEELKERTEEVARTKKEALEGLQKAKDKIRDAEEEVRDEYNELHKLGKNLEDVRSMFNEEQAKFNVAISVQPNVLDEYKRRRREIESLREKLVTLQRDKHKVDATVNKLYSKWKPALDELVANVSERFSRAFEAIGNAGEVRLAEDPDYEKWGIEILVKFRDDEPLQLLTGQRQSGGERSITTITYLLSLTQMSRSPFSLVDEINQGMDQKYERQVHDHMVRVTCAEMAGQYFLITPKLLPDLTYHERMRVLIINNGEWLPEKFDFWHYIRSKGQQQRVGAPVAATSRLAIAV